MSESGKEPAAPVSADAACELALRIRDAGAGAYAALVHGWFNRAAEMAAEAEKAARQLRKLVQAQSGGVPGVKDRSRA